MTDAYYLSKKWLMLLVWGEWGLSRENCRLSDSLAIITLTVLQQNSHLYHVSNEMPPPPPPKCLCSHRAEAQVAFSGICGAFCWDKIQRPFGSFHPSCVSPHCLYLNSHWWSLPQLDSTMQQRDIGSAVLWPTSFSVLLGICRNSSSHMFCSWITRA